MDQTGIGFIVWDEGFACSDDVVFDVEKDPVTGLDGKIILVETKTIKLNHIFEGVSKIIRGLQVFCLFKSGDTKYAFTGIVRGKSGNLTIVDVYATSERINEIISKIKQLGGK